MIIDTSVLIAILENEAEAEQLIEAISLDEVRLISAVSVVEANIVMLNRKGEQGVHEMDELIKEAGIMTVSVDAQQAALAQQAYYNYGKGRHPAKLNFGDCFPYALAKAREQALLFKGNDFNKTDILCCINWD